MNYKGRILDLENGAIKIYSVDFFKVILDKFSYTKKYSIIQDETNYSNKSVDKEEINTPHIVFTLKNDNTESFTKIEESENEDRIFPYIYRNTESNNKYEFYTFKGSRARSSEKTKKYSKREINFYYDSGEPYMKTLINDANEHCLKINRIKYAIFSQENGISFKEMDDPKSQPYVQFNEKENCFIFYQPTRLFRKGGAEQYIQKARDKVFALFAYFGIPIIIQVTGAKVKPMYFLNVWKSPFFRYPELGKITKSSRIYYSTFNALDQSTGCSGTSDNAVSLKYVSFSQINEENFPFISGEKKFYLPLTVVQKAIPYFPDYNEHDNLSPGSLLPVYKHFSEKVDHILGEINFKVNLADSETYRDNANVISFVELGYTPMNSDLPELDSGIEIDAETNILANLSRERSVSSIMEIATKSTNSLFLPLEEGGVQMLIGATKLTHVAFYTRNKNSVFANANAIAAALRTSNVVVIPVTPSHVASFLESLDCAFLYWNRFGLSKYNLGKFKGLTTMVIYFEQNQRPLDQEIATRTIQLHCVRYRDVFDVRFSTISNLNDQLKVDQFNEKYNISRLDLLYSIAAFATVNDCADYLDLNDAYESKSSFAFIDTFRLHIKICQGFNLICLDNLSGKPDPFISLRLKSQDEKEAKKTKVLSNNVNPVWNQEFDLEIVNLDDSLIINLYDKDIFNDDKIMDELVFPIGTWKVGDPKDRKEIKLMLNEKDAGTLIFEAQLIKNT